MGYKNFYRFLGVGGRRLRTLNPICPVPSGKYLLYGIKKKPHKKSGLKKYKIYTINQSIITSSMRFAREWL